LGKETLAFAFQPVCYFLAEDGQLSVTWLAVAFANLPVVLRLFLSQVFTEGTANEILSDLTIPFPKHIQRIMRDLILHSADMGRGKSR